MSEPPPLPPLPVLALDGGTLYSLPQGESSLFPGCGGRYHSTCGNYLVFSQDDGFFLVDPFSNATMTLPGLSCVQARREADYEPVVDDETLAWMKDNKTRTWMEEINDPNELAMHKLIVCSPHLVAALVGLPDTGENQIVVCRPGASSWSVSARSQFMRLRGMAFHQGVLYALDSDMGLLAVDISVDHRTSDPWVSRIRLVIQPEEAMFTEESFEGENILLNMLYLVESHGALLMARRNIWCRRTHMYTRAFVCPTNSEFEEVFEADFRRSRWNEVTTVGDDQVLFLARWSSRAVGVSKYGMPGNRIFFCNDDFYHDEWLIYYDTENFSCSAYDMRDGSVSSPLPMISWERGRVPETWIEFNSWERGRVPATWLFPRD